MVAGAVAVNAVGTGLGFSQPLVAEMHSPADKRTITRAWLATPGVPSEASEQNARSFASRILADRRQAFGAIVAALVERRMLSEIEVFALWDHHAQ